MARGPKKKRRRKQSTVSQRAKGQAKREAKRQGTSTMAPSQEPNVRVEKAQAAWKAHRYDEAIWYYERALARDPNNPILMVDIARAYGLRFRYAEAEDLVERVGALYPDNALLQRMLGRSFQYLQHFDRAIACYEKALELEPASPERPQTMLELAKMYERLHRLDVARECIEESLAMVPHGKEAQIVLATLDRREGNLEAAQSRFQEVAGSSSGQPAVAADAWYQLAQMHDQANHYDEAFDALTHAKQLLDPASYAYREDSNTIVRTVNRTTRTVNSDHFQRWHQEGSSLNSLEGSLTLLTSHPRSGTTLLEQVLGSHPGVVGADEIPILSDLVYISMSQDFPVDTPVPDILDRASQDKLLKLRHNYWQAMEGAVREPIGNRMLLDKNPAMTGLLPVVGRVFPEMKILFALRDPRDVVLSCFMQNLSLNLKSVHYLTLKDTANEYARTMRMWLKLRNLIKNPWLEVRYEQTVSDLENQARKVLDFLELPWDDAVMGYFQSAGRTPTGRNSHGRKSIGQNLAGQKHVRSPTYEAVSKPIYSTSVGRWKNYQKFLEPILETLEPFVDEFGYDR